MPKPPRNSGAEAAPTNTLPAVSTVSLNVQVYAVLRAALLEGRLLPHQRLKIRDLAATMQVSETPVREAVMQLVRERGLILHSRRSLTVPRLSGAQYFELRRIRLELEGLAAAEAAAHVTPRTIREVEKYHAQQQCAEAANDASEAVRLNWHFHALVYRGARMPELFNLIEGLWLRTAPTLTYQYPYAPPTYPGRHRHLDVIDALRDGNGLAARTAIQADILEGGAGLLKLLTEIDAGRTPERPVVSGRDAAALTVPDGKARRPVAPLPGRP
jgi:DNA-binding GntR family transcriptional regulator